MPVVAVVNRKGGSGKSTLATHIAAYAATTGATVMLADVDRQQSVRSWLRERSAQHAAMIAGCVVESRGFVRPPAGTDLVVVDTPGGLTGLDLARVVMYADAILMPVCNSLFDRESAADCAGELRRLPRVASGRCRLAAVGMRVEAGSEAVAALQSWAAGLQLPFIGALCESPTYVRCAEQGLTLFDLPPAVLRPYTADWRPILDWLHVSLRPEKEGVIRMPAALPANDPRIPQRHAGQVTRGPHAPVAAVSPRVLPVPARAAASAPVPATPRIGRLLGVLSIPRFLQRGV